MAPCVADVLLADDEGVAVGPAGDGFVEVLADGVVTEEEAHKLKNMQAKYGMSDEQVEAIAAQVRAEKGH